MSLPTKVFLESTALFQLGTRLENVEFAELQEQRDLLGFEVLVSEVSWREYLRRRRNEVRACINRINSCSADLTKYGLPIERLNEVKENVSVYLKKLPEGFDKRAQALGISILPFPTVDLKTLIDLSINCIAPFEDSQSDLAEKPNTKEKGFRDAVIMFTILENIRKHPEHNAVVVTQDRLLAEGLRLRVTEYETRVDIVETLKDALKHIESRMEAWYRARVRHDTEHAKQMLLKYQSQISEAVHQVASLTDTDPGQGLISRTLSDLKEQLDIHQVKSLNFDSVETALWKDKEKPISRILFRLKCLAHVAASVPVNPFVLIQKNFGVGRTKPTISYAGSGLTPQTVEFERDLPVRLYGEATFAKGTDANTGWNLVEVKVDKSLPSNEDWRELMRVELNYAPEQ